MSAATEPSEAEFQRSVIDLARLTGWRVAHFRPAQNAKGQWRTAVAGDGKGFPDLVLMRDRVLFVELKTNRGSLGAAQKDWRVAAEVAGAEWRLWRPRDWPTIEATLKRTPHAPREEASTP